MPSQGQGDVVEVLLQEHERRLGIVEQKVDKLLDPERGIYPILEELRRAQQRNYARLLSGLVAVFTSIIASLVLVIVTGLAHAG